MVVVAFFMEAEGVGGADPAGAAICGKRSRAAWRVGNFVLCHGDR